MVRCRKNKSKNLVIFNIEKKKKADIRLYAKVIPDASSVSLGSFMKSHISPSAKITTDLWTGYSPLEQDFKNLVRIPSGKKGRNANKIFKILRSEEHTSELQSRGHLVCRLLLEKKKTPKEHN